MSICLPNVKYCRAEQSIVFTGTRKIKKIGEKEKSDALVVPDQSSFDLPSLGMKSIEILPTNAQGVWGSSLMNAEEVIST